MCGGTDAVCRPQFQAHSQSSCLRWEGRRYWARNRCSLCGVCEQGAPSVLVNFRANSHWLSLWSTHDPVRYWPSSFRIVAWVKSQRGLVLKIERVHWTGHSRRKQTCFKPFLTNTLHPWSFLNSTWRCATTQMSDSVFKLLAAYNKV